LIHGAQIKTINWIASLPLAMTIAVQEHQLNPTPYSLHPTPYSLTSMPLKGDERAHGHTERFEFCAPAEVGKINHETCSFHMRA